jgi:1-deoxy-D-xylulose-5-phosphate synthase
MLLEEYQNTQTLYQLKPEQLTHFCEDLRTFLIEHILTYGGHFAANLGVVEVTVALMRHFPAEHHPYIWDVGHQSYAYKILTGRKDELKTIRSYHGISGFPKIDESPYDYFGTGHSSTALSAAMGMAWTQKNQESNPTVIAIIGDGALTGGMCFEALNNLKNSHLNILIIYNDNGMGIDPNAGAVHWANQPDVKSFFEFFGLEYFGPADGHNVLALSEQLEELRHQKHPRILHIKTVKGKGYPEAEAEQTKWHSAPKFVKVDPQRKPQRTWHEAFANAMEQLSTTYADIMGITPAMPSSSGLAPLLKRFPDRFVDVTIAEQHALTFAAGLATKGKKPFVAIYSTFLQRAYDQFIHDIALQQLPVVLCIDRAGLVGEDGPTHHGVFDLSFLLPIPSIEIWSPANESELLHAMNHAYHQQKPVCIRYPKGATPEITTEATAPYTWLKNTENATALLVSTGKTTEWVFQILSELSEMSIDVLHLNQIKPVPQIPFNAVYSHILTVEDGVIIGGMGHYLKSEWTQFSYSSWKHLGVKDTFIPHGHNAELYAHAGYSPSQILKAVTTLFSI